MEVKMGGAGNTRIRSKWVSGDLYFHPVADDTGNIYFGDGTRDMDVVHYLGSTSEYVKFDVGDSEVYFAVPIQMVSTDKITFNADAEYIHSNASNELTIDATNEINFPTPRIIHGASITDGVTLTDAAAANKLGFSFHADVASAITASSVIQGSYHTLYINLDQDADVDFSALTGEIRVNQDLNDGKVSAIWGYFYQTGSCAVSYSSESLQTAVRATVQVSNNFSNTANSILSGIMIESEAATSVTTNGDYVGMLFRKGSSARVGFDYGISFEDCLATAVFDMLSSGTVVSDSDTGSVGTADGYFTVQIGGSTRYAYLWDAKPSE
jgi:hypothetical protein